MADQVEKSDFVYKWTSDDTARFIQARGEADRLFTGQRNSAMDGWKQVLRSVGLEEKVTPQQARKKWDNLKKKNKGKQSHARQVLCPPPAERELQGEARGQKRGSFAAFLREQFEREEQMEKERQRAADERFARLLAVLERMADK
ncbi:hypothetical protein AALO_G00046910 [Alosa alosa]|uniref:Myb/SANT-like DNA-binding domain-containing protein n=1 Tax=Alosa alosa TaxID=278164 RepID=A0AAV6H2S2_9TELE|nr:hypothetical protein AALO_G00046910 [Alosa alosa]